MSSLLDGFGDTLKSLVGDWAKFAAVGSFGMYLAGYLSLRFQLSMLGVSVDLWGLDDRYFFAGARFFVYLVSDLVTLALAAALLGSLVWLASRAIPMRWRQGCVQWLLHPRILLLGLVVTLLSIQLSMKQCFYLSDLMVASKLPVESTWLIGLLLSPSAIANYFYGLEASCVLPWILLLAVQRQAPVLSPAQAATRTGLAVLATLQLLFLPINFGMLIGGMALPHVNMESDRAERAGESVWLLWEGKSGTTTFLACGPTAHTCSLLTLRNDKIKSLEVIGVDPIVPTLFAAPQGTRQIPQWKEKP